MARFLKFLLSVTSVYVYVCVCVWMSQAQKLLITSGVMLHDMSPYDLSNNFYNLYMAAIVGIGSRCGL